MSINRPFNPGDRRGPPGPAQPPGGPPRPVPADGLPPDYLSKGYFDGQGNIWPKLIVDDASRVAQALGQRQGQVELKTSQLRRFYGKVKNVEQKLDSNQTFESLVGEILGLRPMAANAVARKTATGLFKDFIDRNVGLAVQDEKHFRKGFLVHFQSVVAYFTYTKGG